MLISTRTREAIKTALAMTLAFGIALAMNWERPYWAAFAVAFISLATVGQSLNKGAMRMLGTLVAVAVALALIATFPQDRWLFMTAITLWVGFCTYMSVGSKHGYFWTVSGFVAVIVALDGGDNSANAFDTALLRAEETGLGILVYSLVSALVWPQHSGAAFEKNARDFMATQCALCVALVRELQGKGDPAEIKELLAREVEQRSAFDRLLDAAIADTYEVWELRKQWRAFQANATRLMETLEKWRESLDEAREISFSTLLPGLDSLEPAIMRRFELVEAAFAGEPSDGEPQPFDLSYDREQVRALPHFHKAAFSVIRAQMRAVDALTQAKLRTMRDIRGLEPPGSSAVAVAPESGGFWLDEDRMTAAVRVVATIWIAYFAVIYIGDFPAGASFVVMVTPYIMNLAIMPQYPVSTIFWPVSVSVSFAGVIYIFVMPHLAGFAQLGVLIFAVTFAISYLFATPRQALGRAFGLAMFVVIASIDNQQTYDFLKFANTALMVLLLFVLLSITAYFPVSTKPEIAFLRHLKRFFRSLEYLTSTMSWDIDRTPGRLDRWRRRVHTREIQTLPQKLAVWSGAMDPKAVGGFEPERLKSLTTNLRALSFRMQEQLVARREPQSEILRRELIEDLRAWRLRVQDALAAFARDPAAVDGERLRSGLDATLQRLEARIAETYGAVDAAALSEADYENFYRLLGAYRGVAEAVAEHARIAEGIDWVELRQSRF